MGTVTPPGRRGHAGPGDEQRHAKRLVERVVPLLHHPAVGAEQVPVVGGEHDHGVVGEAGVGERIQDPADSPVHEPVQGVVEAAVREVGGLREEHLRPHLGELLVAGRPARERVGLRGRLRDLRDRVVRRLEPEDLLPAELGEPDVVRVDERRDRQPRPVAAGPGELAEQLDDLVGEHPVAHGTAVGLRGAVRLTPDPAREPVRVEPIGLAVRVDRRRDQGAAGVGRHEALVGPGDEEVGVGDVPLAAVVRLVAGGPEPVAERRHRARVEPVHRGVVGLLRRAVGLRHPVQRRILAGEERRPARQARRRPRVVAVELEAAGAEVLACGELLTAEGRDGVALVGRRVPLLVRHHDEDVGLRRHVCPAIWSREGDSNS